MICQTSTQLSLADEAVKLGVNLDPKKRSLLQGAMACAAVVLKKLRLRVVQRKAEAQYRLKNAELLAAKQKARVAINPELYRERTRKWQKWNPEKRRLYCNKYYKSNQAKRLAQKKASIKRHPETRRKWSKRYRVEKGDKIREYHRKYRPSWRAKQMATNPLFVLKDRMRSCLRRGLKNHNLKKTQRTETMVGCTMEELRKHIESQFQPGMSWDNPSSYSIDHIVPLDAFNMLDAEELHWSFNWRNLRPMDLTENKTKHAKVIFPLPSWLPPHIAERITARSAQQVHPRS